MVFGQSGGSGASKPRVQTYEVYVRGNIVATRHSLREAQEAANSRFFDDGEGKWTRRTMTPVEVTHYYFGPTEEFGPIYYWTRGE